MEVQWEWTAASREMPHLQLLRLSSSTASPYQGPVGDLHPEVEVVWRSLREVLLQCHAAEAEHLMRCPEGTPHLRKIVASPP